MLSNDLASHLKLNTVFSSLVKKSLCSGENSVMLLLGEQEGQSDPESNSY